MVTEKSDAELTADDLRDFMVARGWGVVETARQLGTSPASVSLWANGHRPIPSYIARLVRVLDQLDEVRRTVAA